MYLFQVFIEKDLQVTNYIKAVAATRSNLSEVIFVAENKNTHFKDVIMMIVLHSNRALPIHQQG